MMKTSCAARTLLALCSLAASGCELETVRCALPQVARDGRWDVYVANDRQTFCGNRGQEYVVDSTSTTLRFEKHSANSRFARISDDGRAWESEIRFDGTACVFEEVLSQSQICTGAPDGGRDGGTDAGLDAATDSAVDTGPVVDGRVPGPVSTCNDFTSASFGDWEPSLGDGNITFPADETLNNLARFQPPVATVVARTYMERDVLEGLSNPTQYPIAVHFRFRVRALAADTIDSVEVMRLSGNNGYRASLALGGTESGGEQLVQLFAESGGDEAERAQTLLSPSWPAETWFCLRGALFTGRDAAGRIIKTGQIEAELGGETSTIPLSFSLNGNVDAAGLPIAGFRKIAIGAVDARGSDVLVEMDDFALSSEPLSCADIPACGDL